MMKRSRTRKVPMRRTRSTAAIARNTMRRIAVDRVASAASRSYQLFRRTMSPTAAIVRYTMRVAPVIRAAASPRRVFWEAAMMSTMTRVAATVTTWTMLES